MKTTTLFCDDCKKEFKGGDTYFELFVSSAKTFNPSPPKNGFVYVGDGVQWFPPIVEKELCLSCLEKYKK